jgi:hypothetical protein
MRQSESQRSTWMAMMAALLGAATLVPLALLVGRLL